MSKKRLFSLFQRRKKEEISKPFVTVLFIGVLALGYLVGTYQSNIIGAIGPLIGLKVYTGTLDLESVQKTYQSLKANFDGELDDQDLIDGANKGLVEAAGDEYTVYLPKVDAQELDDSLTGSIGGGIGAEIGLRNNQPTVVRVLEDNPAIEAGLKGGDVITKINDESSVGWTVDQAVAKIRGEPGTTVKITATRDNETKEFNITRAIINNPSVTKTISGKLGILTISRFDENSGGNSTAELARTAAQEFKAAGVTSVIIDLRYNGGGYLSAAQSIASLWLDNKTVVTEKSNGRVIKDLKSGSNAPLAGVKTVVLVNGGSASASEIVAGALQDYDVATIVGEKTYGKGSVQLLVPLADGAQLKVTTARWYTPNGTNVTNNGIVPDQVVTMSGDDANAGRDPQLVEAKKILGF